MLRKRSGEEGDASRAQYGERGGDRRPTRTWPRQIPIEGEPADVVEIVRRYAAWLAESEVPKLFVNAEPGAILTGRVREQCRRWPQQTEVTVPASHFIQEDSGGQVGRAVADWLGSL